jgi:hypothetical protein
VVVAPAPALSERDEKGGRMKTEKHGRTAERAAASEAEDGSPVHCSK